MRIAGVVGLGLAGVVACGAGYFQLTFPKYAPADASLHVSADPALRARGEYLAEHVAVCVDCHSERDFDRYSGPLREGTRGKGGQKFGHEIGLPGELVAPNITPAGIGQWSDGELQRALTSGVTREGRALFPLMNYLAYGQMCERDLHAVMSYVRSFAPIVRRPERSHLDFPVNMIVKTLPKPTAAPKQCPDARDPVALGAYLVNTAGCRDCHTPREGGQPIPGKDFAGGSAFPFPSGYVAHSKNITPDAVSGIGGWTQEMFVRRFAAYRDASALPPVAAKRPNTPMPWSMYAGMSDEDLGAIYAYLRTVARGEDDGGGDCRGALKCEVGGAAWCVTNGLRMRRSDSTHESDAHGEARRADRAALSRGADHRPRRDGRRLSCVRRANAAPCRAQALLRA